MKLSKMYFDKIIDIEFIYSVFFDPYFINLDQIILFQPSNYTKKLKYRNIFRKNLIIL